MRGVILLDPTVGLAQPCRAWLEVLIARLFLALSRLPPLRIPESAAVCLGKPPSFFKVLLLYRYYRGFGGVEEAEVLFLE